MKLSGVQKILLAVHVWERESDVGALDLHLIFIKYVQELGWSMKIAQDHVSEFELFESRLLRKSAKRPKKNYLHRNNVGTPIG